MRKDLTDVTVVMDRSGSMDSVKDEAEKGLNHFINDQKGLPGDCNFTLVQFDTEYEFVHKGVPIRDVPHCKLEPRGMTALLDAVGKAINETGARIKEMDEASRPGLVVFVVLTDGHENSSKEFTNTQIKEMIDRQTKDYQWKFTFLGADAKAFDEAMRMGFARGATAVYDAATKTADTYAVMSNKVSGARGQSMGGAVPTMDFSEEDRKDLAK